MLPKIISTSLTCALLLTLSGCASTDEASSTPDLLVQDVPGYSFDGSTNPVVLGGACGAHDALSKLGTVEKQLAFGAEERWVTFVRIAVPDDQAWAAASAGIDQCEQQSHLAASGSAAVLTTADITVEPGPEIGEDRRWYTRVTTSSDSHGYLDTTPTTGYGVVISTGQYVISVTAPTKAEVEKYATSALD
jgi:hypothetical protein